MRNFKTLALAGALAAAALIPATTAEAGHWHRHYGYYGGWNPGGALVAGTVLGLTIGTLAAPRYYYDPYPPPYYYNPPPPPYAGSNPHYDWCAATYRSYNGETDTWVDASGIAHRCMGP